MEIKGIITQGEIESLTCCESIQDLNINGESLYAFLCKHFGLDVEEYFNSDIEPVAHAVKYIVLDETLEIERSFNDASADLINNMIYGSYVSGCYSEYTCGYGGFDYVLGNKEGSHSIFDELSEHKGKYLHLVI